ncbi:MAG: FtsH protease activity modulator HflK [Deltaproteobacteria bacterium]|nr:FtsH protease activity modulator HflK [Deltaproteobacteria bacterium]MBW2154145.1 FtsH protease activity modulator HflK [Deltaproteobacteria bacterium]
MEEESTKKAISRLTVWKHRVQRTFKKMTTHVASLAGSAKKAYGKLFISDDGISLGEDIRGAFRHIPFKKKSFGSLIFLIILAVYFLSGIYTVKPGEVAVSRIFGKEVRQSITEGLHYRLPWPFEAIEKVNVMEIRRIDIGTALSRKPLLFPRDKSESKQSGAGAHVGHGGHKMAGSSSTATDQQAGSTKNQFFTGDENILEIRMNIQYQVKDASDYLFKMNSPDRQVESAARAAVTELFGQMRVDDLLTVAKSSIQKRIARITQNMLDEYKTGLFIVSVNLQEVNPPKEVAQAFRDVASAREEREEKINKAQGYWNTVIPQARGEAHKLISHAEGYKEKVINQARGEAEKFSAMLKEYRRAKEVTEHRLYLETMEMILARAKKFVVDSKKERVNLKFVK